MWDSVCWQSYSWDMTYRMLICRDILNPRNIYSTLKLLRYLKGSLFPTDCESYKEDSEYCIEVQDLEFIPALQNEGKLVYISNQDFCCLLYLVQVVHKLALCFQFVWLLYVVSQVFIAASFSNVNYSGSCCCTYFENISLNWLT